MELFNFYFKTGVKQLLRCISLGVREPRPKKGISKVGSALVTPLTGASECPSATAIVTGNQSPCQYRHINSIKKSNYDDC